MRHESILEHPNMPKTPDHGILPFDKHVLNAGQVVIISVIEAKASRARGHSGHEAPPMTHSLVLTPPL